MNRLTSGALLTVFLVSTTAFSIARADAQVEAKLASFEKILLVLEGKLGEANERIKRLQKRVSELESNTVIELDGIVHLERDRNNNATVVIEGVNLQLINGDGATQTTNGRGNLLIGYNTDSSPSAPTGSHNVVIASGGYAGTGAVVTRRIVSAGSLRMTVGNHFNQVIAGNRNELVGLDARSEVGSNRIEVYGGNHAVTVGNNLSHQIGGNTTEHHSGDVTTNIGRNHHVAVGEDAVLGARRVIQNTVSSSAMNSRNDIVINGKNVRVKASKDLVLKGARVVK